MRWLGLVAVLFGCGGGGGGGGGTTDGTDSVLGGEILGF